MVFVYLYTEEMAANADKQRVFSRFANADIQIYRCFAHSERGERGGKIGRRGLWAQKERAATVSVYGLSVATRRENMMVEKKCL